MTDRIQTVITTDGEVDDMNSFIRALYYSKEMDIRGIVLSASMYHYAGNIKKELHHTAGQEHNGCTDFWMTTEQFRTI